MPRIRLPVNLCLVVALVAFALYENESGAFQANSIVTTSVDCRSRLEGLLRGCGTSFGMLMNITMKTTHQSFCSELLFRIVLTIINQIMVRCGRVRPGAVCVLRCGY